MKTLLSGLLCSLAVCAGGAAQTLEFSALGGYPRLAHVPLGSDSAEGGQDTDTRLRGQYSYGGAFTANTKGYYGHELGFLYSRATLTSTFRNTPEGGTQVVTTRSGRIPIYMGFYNFLIYFMPRGERWRPFITGGAQLYHYGSPHFPEWDKHGSRNYGFNYGGGLKIRLFSHALVRLDARDYIGGKPYGLTFQSETSASTTGNPGSRGRLHTLVGTLGLAITF